jgi:hypothetical protein
METNYSVASGRCEMVCCWPEADELDEATGMVAISDIPDVLPNVVARATLDQPRTLIAAFSTSQRIASVDGGERGPLKAAGRTMLKRLRIGHSRTIQASRCQLRRGVAPDRSWHTKIDSSHGVCYGSLRYGK